MKKRSRKQKSHGANRTVPLPVWAGVLIVLLIGIVAYWNSFDVPLVFDDFLTIQRNSGVRFGDALSPGALGGRSLLYLTFAANYLLHGQEVWGYHLVNLVLHLLNGILILFLALHIFRRLEIGEFQVRAFSFLAAAFFIAHPVQTESVTYVSSRSELLSTFVYISAFLLFTKVPEQRIGFFFSLLIAVLLYAGLLTKETVISLPAALVAYDFLFLSGATFGPVIRRWKFYITFVVGGSAATYYFLTGPLSGAVGGTLPGHLSPWHYLLTQTRVIVRYMQVVLMPVGLNLDYDFPALRSPLEPAVIASSVVILAAIGLAWHLRRRQPVIALSIFWFFLTLAPTSSVAPILDVIFEHRLYLPMVGLCLSFPIALSAVSNVIQARTSLRLKAAHVGAAILVALTVGTILRNEVWRDERTLWTDVVAKSPGKARGYNALAMAHFEKGEYGKGLAVARQGMEAVPEARNLFVDTIGNLYLQLGRYDEAIEVFRDIAETESALAEPDRAFLGNEYNNLGVSYLYKWRLIRENRNNLSPAAFEREKLAVLEPALEAFKKSLEYESGLQFTAFDSYINVMSWLERDGELASEHEALLSRGENFESRYVLGKIAFNEGVEYMDSGRAPESRSAFDAAARQFELAAALSPSEHLFWFNYAYVLERLDRVDDSIEQYTQAIRLNPVFVEAHHNLGQLRMRRQEYAAAVQNFEEVLRLYPGHVSANLHLAKIYMQTGDSGLARRHLSTVLSSSPQHQEALALWQQLGSSS